MEVERNEFGHSLEVLKEYGIVEKGEDPNTKKSQKKKFSSTETKEKSYIRLLVDLGELIKTTATALGFDCE